MAPFPAWMGGFPYRSSSGSSLSSNSKSTIIRDTGKWETTLRRRSPGSAFGYYEEVKVENIYHIDPEHKTTTRSPIHTHTHTHNQNYHAPKPKPKPKPKPATTIKTEFTKFFHREWKCLSRGRWAQSRIAAFSSGPVLIFGSVFLLTSFAERRGRRKSERRRAEEKEGEDWGDGFQ
jgi:hypothetical protein